MKVAYANYESTQGGKWTGYPALAWSGNASRAESAEAYQVLEAAQRVQQHLDERPSGLILRFEGDDAVLYNHIAPKRVFSAKAQYKYIGRMKPRQFPIDE